MQTIDPLAANGMLKPCVLFARGGRQRPSLKLEPRTKPFEHELPADVASSPIYGGAKPRDETKFATEKKSVNYGTMNDNMLNSIARENCRNGNTCRFVHEKLTVVNSIARSSYSQGGACRVSNRDPNMRQCNQ